MVLIALILLTWLLVQTTIFQNWLVRQVTSRLSKDLNTTVSINHVDFALFNKMLLEGTLIKDQKKDTLLYAGIAEVRITDWFFFKDKIELEYIGLKDAVIQLQRTDSTWNYQFLLDYFAAPKKSKPKKNIDLNLKQLQLNNVGLVMKDEWKGENLSAVVKTVDIDADQINFTKKIIDIRTITLDDPSFAIFDYLGTRINSPKQVVAQQITNDPRNLRWNPDGWIVSINKIVLHGGAFKHDKKTERAPFNSFDGLHIYFSNISGTINNINLLKDSLTAKISLSARERSGLQVKKLNAAMRIHPEAMEFRSMDLQTNRSHLQNFFAMRYNSFADMATFISSVRMEANFQNSEVDSDDIAFFAPAVKTWKKKIRLTGMIKGTVEDIHGRNLVLEAGNGTFLNGNISLSGLPEMDKTFIDLEAKNFRTTYRDAIAFVPQLRNVSHPRLDLLEYLKFNGSFTGFLKNFVTYGTLETRLGTVHTDLNMKLDQRNLTHYSGSIKTNGFSLGTFIRSSQIGKASFEGNINGSGMRGKTLNAKLDGKIKLIEFKGYPYQNITVKGTVANKLFNGQLVATDPNLEATLNGLVDFSKEVPQFNFEATISKADLKNLNFSKGNISFNGKFRFNFSGNNIDNFLGTARIYEASIYKNGTLMPFDSLLVESKVQDNNKVITAISNQFDAALAGQFSIKDLPAAFQTFLNKYYPSYIKPSSKGLLKNQNFSFVITTKKVDEYLDFVHKDLNGFNFSTITGRINSNENLLDLNAEIPEFSYKNVAVHDLNLKATGSYDSLAIQSNIGDVNINDSLHFPGTVIRIRSANDISDVTIQTTSNKTLNTANISAEVQTLRNGTKIKFKESNFELNGKSWTIARNGELILSKDLVSAEGVKIYNGQQEILVTTVPSEIGNTNDIKVELKKVNIGDFAPYVVKKNRLEGLLTGSLDIINPFGKMEVDVAAETEQFRLDDDSIGRLTLNGVYNQRAGLVNFAAESDNVNYKFDLKGIYNMLDSTRQKELDITANLNDTKIDLLQRYLSSIFSDITGFATGQLRISGPVNKLNYVGKVQLRDGGLLVKYTNVYYKIPHAIFELKEDMIDFGTFTVEDKFSNTAQVTRARLSHQSFQDLYFDFALNTNKLQVLATDNQGSDPFYGNVIAKANMTFTGPLEDMRMRIRGEPADSSNLYINTANTRQSGDAGFIVWKVYGREMQDVAEKKESNLTVSLDVTANNYVNMFVILDPLTGDIIKANGRGNLIMRMTTDGEFSITGRYDIDRGNYNFNFQSLLRKPFVLREGVGNYIQWAGDPNDATIKIDAEYEADNVRFSDLGLEEEFGVKNINNNVRKYRGKVLVVASLTGQLMTPQIKFDIELPQGNPLKNDPDAALVLQRIENDENELNKQVAFLIVFNSFGPLSTSNQGNIASTAFEGIVINTISGVLSSSLSRQFSNMFQKIFNDKSLRVNFNAQLYSGTNFVNNINTNLINIDRTNLNFTIGKSFLNERLTFTFGSALDFGLSPDQVAATKALQFLPDITAEWKLSPDGKLVLTFFYRDSYNYLSGAGARQNRSGASISYRRDFDNITELWRGKKKKVAEKPAVGVGIRKPVASSQ